MGTAIMIGLVLGVGSNILFILMYFLVAAVVTLVMNLGGGEFTWYGWTMETCYPVTVEFASLGELVQYVLQVMKYMGPLMLLLSLGVCIYVELKG